MDLREMDFWYLKRSTQVVLFLGHPPMLMSELNEYRNISNIIEVLA